MSSVVVNDENRGVCPVQKRSTSESAADIFALEQPTGRPSILRQSQAENLNKNLPKGAKVCFQTPRRDPVTKKIMSPSRVGRMESLDDCTALLESLSLTSAETPLPQNAPTASVEVPTKNETPYPDDEMPIQSKGGYTIDFDNLEDMNPFQSSAKVVLSSSEPDQANTTTPAVAAEHDEVFVSSLSAPEEVAKVEGKNTDEVFVSSLSAPEEVPNIEGKNTDAALDETVLLSQSVENALADLSSDTPSTDTTVIIGPRTETPVMAESSDTDHLEVPVPPSISESVSVAEEPSEPLKVPVVEEPLETIESPLPPKGAYSFDFNDLDSVNPFQTGGAKLQNSPPLGRKAPVSNSPLKEEGELAPNNIEAVPEMPSQPEEKPMTPEAPAVITEIAADVPPKNGKLLLEFNFSDGAEVALKPPPKHLGMKRPPGAKSAPKKPASAPAEKKSSEVKPQSLDAAVEIAPEEIPVSRGAYNIDFDKFDDPNFNPFGTKAKMGGSPPRGAQSALVMTEEPLAAPLQQQSTAANNSSPHDSNESLEVQPSLTKPNESKSSVATETREPCNPVRPEPAAREPPPEPCLLKQSAEFVFAAPDEEFVPGSMFLPNDEQIDYLEQFGSSTFKESALRKQSLYLKFDPLVKESPKKSAPADSASSGFCLPRPSLAIRMMEAAKSEVKQKSRQETPTLLDFPPLVDEEPVVQDPTVLDLLVPTLKQPQRSEGVIVDMLMYSQKDMDAALERAHKQAEEKEQELKAQLEAMTLDKEHMVLIVSQFEVLNAHITAEHKEKEEQAQAELSKVLQEKQQITKDLTDMERSFSHVVKRLDKYKEVLDGFKKNEETLKNCAQSYLARLEKEEKRYQILKTHAEEKIQQANAEIAEVRSKLGTEISALQVQLRREQLKVQSLEKNLEQKTREVEDVTKLCDELIMKVQKH